MGRQATPSITGHFDPVKTPREESAVQDKTSDNQIDACAQKNQEIELPSEFVTTESVDPIRKIIISYMDGKQETMVRASDLRDQLMRDHLFFDECKASGKQPIRYIVETYADILEAEKVNGINFVRLRQADTAEHVEVKVEKDESGEQVITRAPENQYFHDLECVKSELKHGNMDPEVIQRVAECYMTALAAVNVKATFFSAVERIFGNKLGRTYYRQALKAMGI